MSLLPSPALLSTERGGVRQDALWNGQYASAYSVDKCCHDHTFRSTLHYCCVVEAHSSALAFCKLALPCIACTLSTTHTNSTMIHSHTKYPIYSISFGALSLPRWYNTQEGRLEPLQRPPGAPTTCTPEQGSHFNTNPPS